MVSSRWSTLQARNRIVPPWCRHISDINDEKNEYWPGLAIERYFFPEARRNWICPGKMEKTGSLQSPTLEHCFTSWFYISSPVPGRQCLDLFHHLIEIHQKVVSLHSFPPHKCTHLSTKEWCWVYRRLSSKGNHSCHPLWIPTLNPPIGLICLITAQQLAFVFGNHHIYSGIYSVSGQKLWQT